MKRHLAPVVVLGAVAAAFAAVPRVSRAALHAMETSFDRRMATLSSDIPFEILGYTRGVYLEGYGAVFTAEVNLSQSIDITPFQSTIPKEYIIKLHQRKTERVPVLKRSMEDAMLDMAASLDAVPSGEQIVLGVTLFYRKWEDTSGLPSQIVIQAERQKLLDVKLGHAGRSSLDSVIRVAEL